MSKFRTALLAGAMVVGFGAAADAAPITGQIGFFGVGGFDATKATIASASVAFTTDSFNLIALGTAVNFTSPLVYGPPPTLGQIWDLTDIDGDNASFVAISGTASYSPTFTSFSYQGTLSLDGFDNTPGVMTISFDNPQGLLTVIFSANAVANPIPEPASLALLGMGLLGLGFAARRRAA